MNVPAYPLHWPPGWKRSTAARRRSPFKHAGGARLRISDAIRRALPELERLGATEITISTSVRPHLYDQLGDSQDPGAAIYFTLKGAPMVFACDRWDRTADNIAAIAAHVESLRGQARWGVGSLEQAIAGYRALPPMPEGSAWWDVLSVRPDAPADVIRQRRRELLASLHPDRETGDAKRAAEVNEAYQAALAAGRA